MSSQRRHKPATNLNMPVPLLLPLSVHLPLATDHSTHSADIHYCCVASLAVFMFIFMFVFSQDYSLENAFLHFWTVCKVAARSLMSSRLSYWRLSQHDDLEFLPQKHKRALLFRVLYHSFLCLQCSSSYHSALATGHSRKIISVRVKLLRTRLNALCAECIT